MDCNVHFCKIREITFLVGGPWKIVTILLHWSYFGEELFYLQKEV